MLLVRRMKKRGKKKRRGRPRKRGRPKQRRPARKPKKVARAKPSAALSDAAEGEPRQGREPRQARGKPLPLKNVGAGLRTEDFSEGRICFNTFTPKLEYKWDAGVAIGRYLNGLKKGVLLGRSCKHCGRVLIPPRMFCEWCFKHTSEWITLADTGHVNTFSLCYVTWDMKRLTEPQIPAVIEIDGASKGFGILHLLGEVDPFKIRIGMAVRAVWKPPEARQGAITDIKYFKPL